MPRVAAVVALAAVVVAVVVLVLGRGDDGPGATGPAEAYAAAWTRGDDAAAGALTDAPGRATAALEASRAGLDGAKVKAGVTEVTEEGDRATATVTARWEVPNFGTFAYDTTLRLRKANDKWTIRWQPQIVYPKLDGDTRLGTQVDTPVRAPILDRRGRPLIGNRPVIDVAVEVDKATDGTAAALASVLGDDVEPRKLAAAIRKAPPGRFLPVITLREADFAPVADALGAIPGVSLNTTTRPLAPTRDFARAVLGTVGPVTAEQIEAVCAKALVSIHASSVWSKPSGTASPMQLARAMRPGPVPAWSVGVDRERPAVAQRQDAVHRPVADDRAERRRSGLNGAAGAERQLVDEAGHEAGAGCRTAAGRSRPSMS